MDQLVYTLTFITTFIYLRFDYLMNRSRSTTLLSIALSAVLFSGAIVPIMSQQAFAQAGTQDDITEPPWGFNAQNSVKVDLTDTTFASDANPSCLDTTPAGTFFLQDLSFGPSIWTPSNTQPGVVVNSGTPGTAVVTIPNFIDPLLRKDFQIQVTSCPAQQGQTPTTPAPVVSSIACNDPTGDTAGIQDSTSGPQTGQLGQTPGSTYSIDAWHCFPNPDDEQIIISYDTTQWTLIQVVVDTISTIDPDPPVGGTFEGVNTAALLVAGAQANALWLIPLITAIGIGIVIAKRRPFF